MEEGNGHKVLVGFKCSPELRLTLCEQAEKMGITLSSHIEGIVASYKNKDNRINELSEELDILKERIAFYEHPKLIKLYEKHKDKTVKYKDSDGNNLALCIKSIADIFTIIINCFSINP